MTRSAIRRRVKCGRNWYTVPILLVGTVYFQRFFGIVRSCGRGQDAPTASTFLRIYRMLSIYVPVKNDLRIDGNIDEEERMHILTSYKDWMLKKFKENVDK